MVKEVMVKEFVRIILMLLLAIPSIDANAQFYNIDLGATREEIEIRGFVQNVRFYKYDIDSIYVLTWHDTEYDDYLRFSELHFNENDYVIKVEYTVRLLAAKDLIRSLEIYFTKTGEGRYTRVFSKTHIVKVIQKTKEAYKNKFITFTFSLERKF